MEFNSAWNYLAVVYAAASHKAGQTMEKSLRTNDMQTR